MSDEPERIKIFFLGEEGVGKTSIIFQFMTGIFHDDMQHTVGITFTSPDLIFSNGETINLTNLDVPGEEQYIKYLSWLLDDFSFIVLVYNIQSKFTFERLKTFWFEKLKDKKFAQKIIAVVANKCDSLEREVTDKEGKKFADDINALFFNTIATNKHTIFKLYEGIIKKINDWDEEVKLKKILPDRVKNVEEEKKEIRGGEKNQHDKKGKKGPSCC